MNNEKLEVIIDGANIFHDDRGIVMKDEEGERITQSRPERVAAVISLCESKGWKSTAILKQLSYYIASKNKDSEYERITLNYNYLSSARNIILLIHGLDKMEVLNKAMEENNPMKYPISVFFNNNLEVYWSR